MTTPQPLPRAPLVALVALAAVSALWALFQWGELLVVRAGGTAFCSVGGTVDCAAVWDSAFAKAVHATTRVPVAGWGLIWGLVAFALSLAALADPDRAPGRGLAAALRVVAIAGVVSVVGLIAASVAASHLCLGCLGTYVVTLAWSGVVWSATRAVGMHMAPRGVLLSGGAVVASYLVLLYPGMQTPRSVADIGKDAIKNVGTGTPHATPPTAAPTSTGYFDGPLLGNAAADALIAEVMSQVPPDAYQLMADLLGDYETKKPGTAPPPRVVLGNPNAPARFVDWTDPLCPHCAELHEVLDQIGRVSDGAFAIEPHHFPLDGLCNGKVQRKNEAGPVRCEATKALICLENDPARFALAQKVIFEAQNTLTPEKLWEVLKPIADKKQLAACMESAETQKIIDADAAAADANDLHGTPLVLLNGKEINPWGPLLYALAVTNGKTRHPAFKVLPNPRPLKPHQH